MGMITHKEITNYKEMSMLLNAYKNTSVKCKCGHTNIIPVWEEKILCSWCKNYVYRDKKAEFKDKLIKEIRNEIRK